MSKLEEEEEEEEEEEIHAVLSGIYRQYIQGESVCLFKADKAIPLCYLSNFAEVESGITYQGIVYPTVEHAYQAQKFLPECRPLFSLTGMYGNPTDHFDRGWNAYFKAKTPTKKNINGDVEKKKNSQYAKKRTMGVLAKMVNTLSRKPRKLEALNLKLDPHWNFNDAHEKMWLDLLRSKYRDPKMKEHLLATNHDYLIEYQKMEKKKVNGRWTQDDHVDFYTAYYNLATQNCAHCNEPACNSMGKFLMKIPRRATRKPKSEHLFGQWLQTTRQITRNACRACRTRRNSCQIHPQRKIGPFTQTQFRKKGDSGKIANSPKFGKEIYTCGYEANPKS